MTSLTGLTLLTRGLVRLVDGEEDDGVLRGQDTTHDEFAKDDRGNGESVDDGIEEEEVPERVGGVATDEAPGDGGYDGHNSGSIGPEAPACDDV